MAVALTLNTLDVDGAEMALESADASGNTVANDGEKTFVVATNGDASETTLTFETPFTVGGVAIAEHAVAIPAGETWIIGPFPVRAFSRTLTITYSSVTSLTVGAFKI